MATAQQQPPPQTALAGIDYRQAPVAIEVFGADRIQQIIEQIGRGWRRPMELAELEHIGLVCQRTRLDPLVVPKLIWFIQRWDKNAGKYVMTPQTSINGLRTIAARSRDYAGQVGPQWCADDGQWRDIWTSDRAPAAARVGVLRRGTREPIWSVINWSEFAGDTQFWRDRPAHMLAKVAESHALMRACPAETNELELAHLEEMERLEVPARAAEYVRIHGSDQDNTALYDIPAPRALPTREREVDDAPRPQSVPTPDTTRHDRLIEEYAKLVDQALELKLIIGSPMDWIRAAGGTDQQIIEKGRELRAKVNKATAANAKPPEEQTDEEVLEDLANGELEEIPEQAQA